LLNVLTYETGRNKLNSILIAGTITVTGALIAYSLFVFTKPKQGTLSRWAITILSIGLFLDISATILMITGSQNIPITPHGIIGYSALAVMLLETIFIWRHWIKKGKTEPVSRRMQNYTWFAYSWWVLAFIIGGLLAAFGIR